MSYLNGPITGMVTPSDYRSGSPAVVDKDGGFTDFHMSVEDAFVLKIALLSLIRSMTRNDNIGKSESWDMCRASRMVFELSTSNVITNLSLEDVNVIKKIPKSSDTEFLCCLTQRLNFLKSSGAADPVEADLAAKCLHDHMND